ncbi:MAG: GDP-L-fucose synthase [Halioglobus sp.]
MGISVLDKSAKYFVAGHRGMVGSAIVRSLRAQGCHQIITRGHDELDLLSQLSVREFMQAQKPDYVILAAARVGGIHANNTYPAEFIYQNLMIEANVIHEAYSGGVHSLLFLGSSCIYPRLADQPMLESALLTGELESTNEPYAIAKIAGIKLCESYNRQYGTDYRSVMPTNLYGPQDNFHLENSHVIPALIRKFHDAVVNNQSAVEIWGTGNAMREFLHVDDMAAASLHVMGLSAAEHQAVTAPMLSHINVGAGVEVTIRQLAETISEVVGFGGDLIFDSSRPDGTGRKLMDTGKLNSLGWLPQHELKTGLDQTYQWFVENHGRLRG